MSLLGFMMMAAGSDTIGTVSIGDLSVSVSGGGPVSASYALDPSGAIFESEGRSLNWISPQVGMDLFQSRVTNVTGGGLTAGTVNTWQALTSSRSWSLEVSVGSLSTSFTLEIRRASDSVVVDTATITLFAEAL